MGGTTHPNPNGQDVLNEETQEDLSYTNESKNGTNGDVLQPLRQFKYPDSYSPDLILLDP